MKRGTLTRPSRTRGAIRDAGFRGFGCVSNMRTQGARRLIGVAIPFYLVFGCRPVVLRLASLGFHWRPCASLLDHLQACEPEVRCPGRF